MSNPEFPSGPWTGFFNYEAGGQRHRMDLSLSFESGRIAGAGADGVGRFLIRGRYDAAARECWWTKTYPASHDVAYHGFREGRGIWGTWEIAGTWRGGFHIWPLGHEEREASTAVAEQGAPAELPRSPTLEPAGPHASRRWRAPGAFPVWVSG